jgi:thiamine biosynthesis lipoprotein
VTVRFRRLHALGTVVVIGAREGRHLATVTEIVGREIEGCDRACSRFREDSELSRLNNGEDIGPASEWFRAAVATAVQVAESTGGSVDPTIGQTLIDLGYDRTFADLDPSTPLSVTATHVPAWRSVVVDDTTGRVRVPARVRLDLGATAKALCADRAASSAATEAGTGVLVSLGGDIAVAGPAPDGGWRVRVTDRADSDPAAAGPGQTVSLTVGGLATSGTSARRWSRAGADLHHVVDPRTGRPAEEVWRTASVAAPTCVAANGASTTAVIRGSAAIAWLTERGFDARLVGTDGAVATTGAWPADDSDQVPA